MLVREHIYEKFVQDSDPIEDMNIGMLYQIKAWSESIGEEYENKDEVLLLCAQYGKIDFIRYLLEIGADVHAGDDRALRWASGNGHADVVELLLKHGVDVHAGDDRALRWANKNGHVDVIKVIKDHIAKEKKGNVKECLNEKFSQDSDPITDMGIGLERKLKDWLDTILYHEDPNISRSEMLMLCLLYDKKDFVSYLLTTGAEVHVGLDYSLRWASKNGHKDIVDLCISLGADIGADENSSLCWASLKGYTDIVKSLLDAGADVAYDNYKAIKWARERGNKNIVKLLQDHIMMKNKNVVKESLLEKFTEDSDPIEDMGIGVFRKRNFKDKEECMDFIIEFLPTILKTKEIPDDIISVGQFGQPMMRSKYYLPLKEYVEKYTNIYFFKIIYLVHDKLLNLGYTIN